MAGDSTRCGPDAGGESGDLPGTLSSRARGRASGRARGVPLILLKLILLVAVWVAALLGGAIPLRGRARPERLLAYGNAFAAGVFLGAGLIHMLPDANEAWSALGWSYPMAYLLAATAVLAMLLFEHVLLPDTAHEMVHAPAGEHLVHAGRSERGGVAAYAILLALSVHAFVAGLALGAQPEIGGALVIFVAIMAHKSTAGFALGVSLVRNGITGGRAWGLLWFFAITTPAGIGVGALLDEALEGPVRVAFEASFLALAAGTFAYVATLDILRDEFHGPGGRGSKWALVALGTGLMGLLAIWV